MKKWINEGLQIILLSEINMYEEILNMLDVKENMINKRKYEELLEALDELRQNKDNK